MTKTGKLLARMRTNPRGWRIEQLEALARRYGIHVRKTGGTHFVFLHPDCELVVTVPFRRPVKPVYVHQFLALLEELGVEE